MKKLVLTLMICGFFAATGVFGQNYGNFLSAGSTNNVSLGIWHGSGTIDPNTRFYVNSSVNGAEIRTSGAYKTGLFAYSSGYSSTALRAQAAYPHSFAARFLGEVEVIGQMSIGGGVLTLGLPSHEKLAIRNGMITTAGIGNGINLNGSYFSSTPNDFGTQRYGLFMGDGSLVNLSTAQNNSYNPMVLSNFYGLGFDVSGGKMTMCQNGAVYIGSNDAGTITRIEGVADKSVTDLEYRLYVEKGIRAEKVKVDAKGNWPDFVFEEDYNLPSLTKVENYITQNKHLPNVPSAAEVEKDGLDLAEMDKILLRKIEELTLYTIEQQKQIETLQKELERLKN